MVYGVHLRAEVRAEETQVPVGAPYVGHWTRCEGRGNLFEYRLDEPGQYPQRGKRFVGIPSVVGHNQAVFESLQLGAKHLALPQELAGGHCPRLPPPPAVRRPGMSAST